MALHPEVDTAIDEVVNGPSFLIWMTLQFRLKLSNLEVGENIKTKIREEFENVKRMLDFDRKSTKFSVDGISTEDFIITR